MEQNINDVVSVVNRNRDVELLKRELSDRGITVKENMQAPVWIIDEEARSAYSRIGPSHDVVAWAAEISEDMKKNNQLNFSLYKVEARPSINPLTYSVNVDTIMRFAAW
jgi:hypothetical protein